MESRYGFASCVMWALRILAFFPAAAGAVAIIQTVNDMQTTPHGAAGNLAIGMSGLVAIGLLAIGLALFGLAELLSVAIGIEANTRDAGVERQMMNSRQRELLEFANDRG
jgi:hypothetical protein